MEFDEFRRQIRAEVFDYQLIASYFGNLSKVRDKIFSLIADKKIIRIKKGLYVFGENWRRSPLNLELVANLLYGPSCISFEYALAYYGLIAERPRVITSLALGDSKVFRTPIGQFEYKAIDSPKFKIGIEYINVTKDEGFFIASKEKALIDFVYRTPKIRTITQLTYFLFEEMRIDEQMFRELNFDKLHEIANIYEKNSVKMLSKL